MSLENFARAELTKLLIELGIPANLQGFRCLRECAVSVIKDPTLIKGVTKKLYPEVGKKLGIDGTVVERGMRHCTDIGFYKTAFKPLCRVFGTEEDVWNIKPSSSELIALLADYINIEASKQGIEKEESEDFDKNDK